MAARHDAHHVSQRHRLPKERLVNLTGDNGHELGSPASHTNYYQLLYGPPHPPVEALNE